MSHILRRRREKKKFSVFQRKEKEPEPKPKTEPKPKCKPKSERKRAPSQPNTGLGETVTTITVNFKTPELTFDAVTSFRAYYSDIPYILIDNGGCLKSLALGRRMAHKGWVHFVSNSKNVGHGLALNQGLAMTETPYAFLLDSDTKTERGGFLEKMLTVFDEDDVFAVGWLRYVNRGGVAYRGSRGGKGFPYIHPYACLLDVDKFHSLCPFVDTGAPAINLMRKAVASGYKLIEFPIEDYIWHKVAGTRGLFRGNCHPKTDAEPGTWHRRGI